MTISTDIITTIAGSGSTDIGSYSGDGGQATSATLYRPHIATLDTAGLLFLLNIFTMFTQHFPIGNVYIADTYNERVRKVTISTGIITTIAGTGASSYTGDNGPATSAALRSPTGISLDASGIIIHFYLNFLCYFLFP